MRIIKKITANCNTLQTRQNNMMGSDMSVVRIVKFVATTTGSLFAKVCACLDMDMEGRADRKMLHSRLEEHYRIGMPVIK